jgi:Flp pilus assembly pilin Flp
MSRRLREQRGQTATEYMGVLLIVALIIAALAMSDVPGKVVDGLRNAVCSIAGAACPEDADARTEPTRTPATTGGRDG